MKEPNNATNVVQFDRVAFFGIIVFSRNLNLREKKLLT